LNFFGDVSLEVKRPLSNLLKKSIPQTRQVLED
jgi:hypothetical protein